MIRLALALTLLVAAGPAWAGEIRLQDLRERMAAPNGTEYAWKAVGPARVIDGDTLVLLSPRFYVCPGEAPCPDEYSRAPDMTVRLYGIDAPELEQPCYDAQGRQWRCGERAAMELIDIIGPDEVTCFGGGTTTGTGKGGKHVAVCHVWPRAHLGVQMLLSGYAVAEYYADADARTYRDRESAAKRMQAGMWRGDFMRPDAWRIRQDSIENIMRDLREREREIGPLREN